MVDLYLTRARARYDILCRVTHLLGRLIAYRLSQTCVCCLRSPVLRALESCVYMRPLTGRARHDVSRAPPHCMRMCWPERPFHEIHDEICQTRKVTEMS